MYAVITTYEKNDKEDKITYNLIDAKNILNYVSERMDVDFVSGNKRGSVFFFDNKEDAEKCMGSK